ncbi:Aerobic C4-dicarboxylate transporter for fumarate, L-malate, D-malate, succunate, aspartate [Paenibacillus pasadenensis]|uniref:Aerobic C4-dicarboxylate transporter for fumarate, L-malate, D-malate, succunate, aspartate n=1 Tax=Paenibacillus pasadenensis TaxID=217090 RepID=A0A2N5NBW3_9BACL|nr:dicarboxylate/amino acid:cation symporter [Paenibacillus pasadenensis]PLT47760.1 Aerobic C4-dicarboxylate transporter for fumarate, L-malate, D-malate, succunate, aspartate [Paenibacillus pasadenensis]
MKINFRNLTVQVLTAIVIGIAIGYFFPSFGASLKVLADVFIKLIKMVITPIVFFTIVIGFAGMGSMKKIGRIGGKALLYFELVTTFAMAIGIAVAFLIRPGDGIDTSGVDSKSDAVAGYAQQASETSHGFKDFLLGIIPDNAIAAMASGQMLPVLFFSVLFGLALSMIGEKGRPVTEFFEKLNEIFFKIVGIIMRFSPYAAGGAMAYTIGKFGLGSLLSLGKMMVATYMTMFLFIIVILGLIARYYKFSIFGLIRHIKEEILLVLGTSSSESALPRLMNKMETYGCSKPVVGLVVPTGYSFNLDGTSIYLSMAALFIAQAYGIELTLLQILTFLGVLMLTSKGAAGVTGSGFITLAATLAALPGHPIPLEGIALLIGVDRFMSEARAITNLIGNSVATVVIAKSENQFQSSKEPGLATGTAPGHSASVEA